MSRFVGSAVLGTTLLLAVAAASWALRYGLWLDGEPGPGLFPLVACGLTAAATLAVALEVRRGVPAATPAEDEEATPTPGRLVVTMAIVLAWGVLLQPLGYAVASGLALLALMLVGGVGLPASALIAVAAIAATEMLFVRLLQVPLPSPAWF